jgi:hypothetical protein
MDHFVDFSVISGGDNRISLRCGLGVEEVAVSGVGELGAS